MTTFSIHWPTRLPVCAALLVLVTSLLMLLATTAHAQARYAYSAAGDEVTDTQTGLTWRRCSEGLTWSGSTCIGTATSYTHEQALAQAATLSGTAGWRLPNVKELASITDTTRFSPAIDPVVFPATTANWYWSSTPYAAMTDNAMAVQFVNGLVSSNYRYHGSQVRLVR